MTVALPTAPWPTHVTQHLIDYGGIADPAAGGVNQRFVRVGTRWSVDFVWPAIAGAPAQAFMAALFAARASGSTLLASWPQPAFATAIGAPVVSGAGQAGESLATTGWTVGAFIPQGTFFSFVVAGRTYLHATTADVTVPGGGAVTLALCPYIRAAPANAAALNFASPQIEGFTAGGAETWTLERLAWITPKLSIAEVQ